MFGRSPFDETINGDARFAFNDQAVGRNLISGYVENIPFTDADNDSLLMIRDALGSPDHVLFEALFQGILGGQHLSSKTEAWSYLELTLLLRMIVLSVALTTREIKPAL